MSIARGDRSAIPRLTRSNPIFLAELILRSTTKKQFFSPQEELAHVLRQKLSDCMQCCQM